MKKTLSMMMVLSLVCAAAALLPQQVLAADSGLANTEQDCDSPIFFVPLKHFVSQGNAETADVLEGRFFSNSTTVGLVGTLPDNGSYNILPDTFDQIIPMGFHDGSGVVRGDAWLLPENIRRGTSIFTVTGTAFEPSGEATADQVLSGFSFSNATGVLTGTMPDISTQTVTPGTSDQLITRGYHNGAGIVAGDANLKSVNIKASSSIFGVAGDSNVVNTSSGDATAWDIMSPRKAWVKGEEITGEIPEGQDVLPPTYSYGGSLTTTIPDGLYQNKTVTLTAGSSFSPENIRCGVSIMGLVGTAAPHGAFVDALKICDRFCETLEAYHNPCREGCLRGVYAFETAMVPDN